MSDARAGAINNEAPASIAVMVGATGAGKSAAINCALRAAPPARLMIFDPGEDYTATPGAKCFRHHRALLAHVIEAGQGPFVAVLVPELDQDRERAAFNWFCHIGYLAGNMTVIADELEDVVLPTWAPAGWRLIVRKGRKRGIRIVASSQRPAGLEKSVWSFATIVRAGILDDEHDAAVVARRLRVHPHEILALPALAYIQWRREGRIISTGRIEWRQGVPWDVTTSEKQFTPPAPPEGVPIGKVPIG